MKYVNIVDKKNIIIKMEKLPTVREFYDKHISDDPVIIMKDYAKLHVQACKKDIAEDYCYYLKGDEGSKQLDRVLFFKEAYPLTNIK